MALNSLMAIPKDSKWYGISSDSKFRKIFLNIARLEAETEIKNYTLNTDIEIIESSRIQGGILVKFFKVYYAVSWNFKRYYDIDRKTNKYQSYLDTSLFNCAMVEVYYQSEDKAKTKARIKKIIDAEIKADMIFYAEEFQTTKKPSFNFMPRSENLEKRLRA